MLVDAVGSPDSIALQTTFAAERPRLVAFCAHVSGSWDAAEDLAQETLLEAWRVRDRLRNSDGVAPWLTAVARNVCLRWRRSKGRESASFAHGEAFSEALAVGDAEDETLVVSAEHADFGVRLENALATLPAVTRAALIGNYVNERPQAELAAQLGLSEGALRVRLHRGRMALRQALTPADTTSAEDGWHTTRIWCPFCGRRRLKCWVASGSGAYSFHCSGPCLSSLDMIGSGQTLPPGAQGLTSPKSLLARHCLNLGVIYRNALITGRRACVRCGSELPVRRWLPGDLLPDGAPPYGIYLQCAKCDLFDGGSPWHLSLDTPEAQRFWRRYPRMRALPTREIETGGRPALVIGYESMTGGDRLEIIADRVTYETLRVYGEAPR
jgi:RNA polymerase sigma-70 factor (ECF subfamily)